VAGAASGDTWLRMVPWCASSVTQTWIFLDGLPGGRREFAADGFRALRYHEALPAGWRVRARSPWAKETA
jgi:hypothetical protein